MVQGHRGRVDVVGSLVGVGLSVHVQVDIDSGCRGIRGMAVGG